MRQLIGLAAAVPAMVAGMLAVQAPSTAQTAPAAGAQAGPDDAAATQRWAAARTVHD